MGVFNDNEAAAWYLHCLGHIVWTAGASGGHGAWGRGAARARQVVFTLMNEQVTRNTSKFKQNTLWCSVIWLLSSSLLSLVAELQNKQQHLPFFNRLLCSQDGIKISFSSLGLVSWGSFRNAGISFFSFTLARTSVAPVGWAGRQEWATDLDRFVSHLEIRTDLSLG